MSNATTTERIRRFHPAAVSPRTETGEPATPDLESLRRKLWAIVDGSVDQQSAFDEFNQVAIQLTNALLVVYFTPNGDSSLTAQAWASADPRIDTQPDMSKLAQWCHTATTENSLQINSWPRKPGIVTISLPVERPNAPKSALSATLVTDTETVEPFAVSVQLIAAHFALWHLRHAASIASPDMFGEIAKCEDPRGACEVIASRLQRNSGCDYVAVGLKTRRGACELEAISSFPDFDPRSPIGHAFLAAMDESCIREEPANWPPQADADRCMTLAHQKLVDVLRADSVASVPLFSSNGDVMGSLLFVGKPSGAIPAKSRVDELAVALDLMRRAESGPIRKRLAKLSRAPRSVWARTLLGVSVLIGVLALPIPHQVKCLCTIEPVERRFSVAPFAGLLEDSFVQAGDIVEKDQVLAIMEGREVAWELTGKKAERDRAAKQYDAALAEHDVPGSQMARLETQRLDLHIKLLEYRQEHLQIRCPVGGVVLRSWIEGAQQAPVTMGGTLYELATLEQVKLEIEIPQDEIPYVEVGHTVSARLDGYPGHVFKGTIARVYPRAETREHGNVFLGELILDNPDGRLRPGITGRAKILSGRRSLGWIVFHKAIRQAMYAVGW